MIRTHTLLARLTLSAMMISFISCSDVQEYEDVSGLPEFRSYVGAEYTTKEEMTITGVNAPPGYGEKIDYYVVHPSSPSWNGPEVITREPLAAGTRLTIEFIHRCTNCLFGLSELTKAKIRVEGFVNEAELPIHIQLDDLSPDQTERKNGPANQSLLSTPEAAPLPR